MSIGTSADRGSSRGSRKGENLSQVRNPGYQPTTYNNRFRSQVQNPGFTPVRAINNEKKIEKQNQQIIQDQKNQETALRRDTQLGQTYLNTQQNTETAEFNAAVKIADAQRRANNAKFNGLLALSETAVKGLELYGQERKKIEEYDNMVDALTNTGGASIYTPSTDSTPTESSFGITHQESTQIALGDASTELAVQGITEDPVEQEQIRETSAEATSIRVGGRGNALSITMDAPAYLTNFMQSDTQIQLPDGRVIRARDAGPNEVTYVARVGMSQYLNETGLLSLPRSSLTPQIFNSLSGTLSNVTTNRLSTATQVARQRRLETVQETLGTTIVSGTYTSQELFEQMIPEYMATGDPNLATRGQATAQLVQDAVAAIENNPSLSREEKILRLEALQQVNPTGQGNARLGNQAAGKPLQDAIDRIDANYITETNRRGGLAEAFVTNNERDRFAALGECAPGDRQCTIDTNLQFDENLRRNGSPEAIAALNTRDSLPNSINYNPNFARELFESGVQLSPEQIEEYLTEGSFMPDDAKLWGYDPETRQTTYSVAQADFQNWDSRLNRASNGILESAVRRANPQATDDEIKEILSNQGQFIAPDLRIQIEQGYIEWLGIGNNINASDSEKLEALANITERLTDFHDDRIVWNPETQSFEGYQFGGIEGGGYSANMVAWSQPTRVAGDSNTFNSRVYTQFTPESIISSTGRMDGTVDHFLTPTQLGDDYEAILRGDTPSMRTRQLAEHFDMTPTQFVQAQGIVQGDSRIANLDTQLSEIESNPETRPGTIVPNDPRSGADYISETYDIPRRNASYLSGNIMQESGWDPNREPWDDGGEEAGGLVSWRGDRLRRIENHMGVNVETATPQQQLDAMMWEMRTFPEYRQAYNIFNNPRASDAQLRRASQIYWGYGVEGERFTTFLNQARQETGIIQPVQGRQGVTAQTVISRDGSVPNTNGEVAGNSKVTYINQRSSETGAGDRECFSAVSTMLANGNGRSITFGEYNNLRGRYGDTTDPNAQVQALGELGIRVKVEDNGSIEEVKRIVASGQPVAIGIMPYSGSGHWILVTGVTPDGDLRVHDPYGQLVQQRGGGWQYRNGRTRSNESNLGRDVVYSDEFLTSVFEDRGQGTGRIMRYA